MLSSTYLKRSLLKIISYLQFDLGGKPLPVKLVPHKGIGFLSFGESLEQIRAVLGNETKVLNRKERGNKEYVFEKFSCIIEVSEAQGIVGFQFFAPAMPCFDGENLLSLPLTELARTLSQLDPATTMGEGDVIRAPTFGIAALAPNKEKAPHKPADAIFLTCKDYWG